MLPPSVTDSWRLLTPLNIQTRRLWPWSFSMQKFISAGEPRPRQSRKLLITSDYGGEHPRATHNIYCFLVVRAGASEWYSAIRSARRSLLPDGRTMSYKRLDDPQRQEALVPFLRAAANLDGHLVALAVDKRKKWLSTMPESMDFIRKSFGLKGSWNPRSFEAMIRKVQFTAILLSIWARPFANVTWITDQDEFVANDTRHDDALLAVARMTSLYLSHPMSVLRFNTTGQDPEHTDYEDLCAIPDLAAGMLSEISTQLSNEATWEDKLRRVLRSPLPVKTDIIADWFWDERMMLRKTFVSIDIMGSQYSVRKICKLDEKQSAGDSAYDTTTITSRGD